MEWMLMPLKRYADFSGRSRRMEYWMFALAMTVAFVALDIILGIVIGASAMHGTNPDGTVNAGALGGSLLAVGIMLIAFLAIVIPLLAVQVRRFHDQDMSGWMALINLIPLGSLVVFVFMCLPGTVGPNKYGADPFAGERLGASGSSVSY